MPRYIDAEIAQKFFRAFAASKEIKPYTKIDWDTAYRVAADSIDDIPTADVAPVVHGHWIKKIHEWDLGDPPSDYTDFTCSKCKIRVQNKTPFCSECGARMDEEEKK